ncbi:MAG: hypothetical protein U1D30_19240 [Planctomycetota bacterium]
MTGIWDKSSPRHPSRDPPNVNPRDPITQKRTKASPTSESWIVNPLAVMWLMCVKVTFREPLAEVGEFPESSLPNNPFRRLYFGLGQARGEPGDRGPIGG